MQCLIPLYKWAVEFNFFTYAKIVILNFNIILLINYNIWNSLILNISINCNYLFI